MTPQGNPKNLCVGELERDKRIRVKSIIKKRKNFNQQTKVSVHVIKDNSISLLEFVFDLNFDEILKKNFLMRSTVNVEVWKYIIIFPKNPKDRKSVV